MNDIFRIVYNFLKWIEKYTGFTYHEVNIIVYYVFFPAIFIYYVDRILKINFLKKGFGLILIITLTLISDFEDFSTILFNKSVDFLNWFDVIGMNYIQASVVICVIIPAIILYLLIKLNRKGIK